MKINTTIGEIEADAETVRLLLENPWNGSKGVLFGRDGVCLGVKTLANPRTRKDGVTTGQVYCGKPNVPAWIEILKLERGESIPAIITRGESGKPKTEETFTFPAAKKGNYGDAYANAGYLLGMPPAVMAWQFRIQDPKLADIVRKLLVVCWPGVADGYHHRLSWPDEPVKVQWFTPPPQLRTFRLECNWGWQNVAKHYGLSVVHDSPQKWQRVLGWKGNDGAAAAIQCQRSMHSRIGTYFCPRWGALFVSADMVPENPDWEV